MSRIVSDSSEINRLMDSIEEESKAMKLARQPKEIRDKILGSLTEEQRQQLLYDWDFWARPKQKPIPGDWTVALYNCGRFWGKLLCKLLKIKTLSGWKVFGELEVGDFVFDEQGNPTKVLSIFDDMPEKAYRIHFSDNTYIDAGGEHLWSAWSYRERKQYYRKRANQTPLPKNWVNFIDEKNDNQVFGSIKTTEELFKTCHFGKRLDNNYCIPNTQPLKYEKKRLPIDSYLLGVFIGDGISNDGSICGHVDDIVHIQTEIESRGYKTLSLRPSKDNTYKLKIEGFHKLIREIGLLNNKHIPQYYLEASFEQRLDLLKGLMDTDGTVSPDGNKCELSQSNESLAYDFVHLIRSLGMTATINSRQATLYGVNKKINYRIYPRPTMDLFTLPRKSARLKPFLNNTYGFNNKFHRMITKIEEIPIKPMRCITVDSPNSMYLIGEQLIPTHNTRTGAEYVRKWAKENEDCRIALVGATAADARDVMLLGNGGIMNVCPPDFKPKYEPSKRKITWPNGSMATLFSADEPDRLRGPEHHFAWADELAAWKRLADAWSNLMLGLRVGINPKVIITTTPRPLEFIIDLIEEALNGDGRVVLRTGSTFENQSNAPKSFLDNIIKQYENTEIGKQEIYAQILQDLQGALWNYKMFHYPTYNQIPEFKRTIVSIDPAVTSKKSSDQTGICVASKGENDQYYVQHLQGYRLSPLGWAEKAVALYKEYHASKIIAEINNGGEMVESTIRTVTKFVGKDGRTYEVNGKDLPVKTIHTSKGKKARAEPVVALYEQGKVWHLEQFEKAEKQMVHFMGDPSDKDDMVDAVVYALLELSEGTFRQYQAPKVGGRRKIAGLQLI